MIAQISTRQSEMDIAQKRGRIYQLMTEQSKNIKSGTIISMSAEDIEMMFRFYDRFFLNNWLSDNFRGKFKFSLSKRMIKSAGMTLCPKSIARMRQEDVTIEIRIGVDFFYQYDAIGGSKTVCGIRTENSLQALLLVFEHELCHAIEFILFKKSSCKGKRFKSMAANMFGHTETSHKLPTVRQIAGKTLGVRVGDVVSFFYGEKRMRGIIHAINKRATIMVRDNNGGFIDRHGNRYAKYYIPLDRLE